ncbi:MAG TPA: helical backbone metal receptor, partial [Polyangiaceae bacterium]|nr:helical backbone metal receptor [Polyangiaceae bacterium]
MDDLGSVAPMAAEPRIVCLVPSITELLCDLGLSEQVVGRTGFCIHPWETVRTIPKVGGTKDLKFDRIRELEPTHVVVNVDENRKEDAEALAEFVPNVVVTHPQEPRDNLALYRQMGAEFARAAEAEALCGRFEQAYERAAASADAEQRVLYLIWRDPWMTVARETYIA